jgi:hypothetical protein
MARLPTISNCNDYTLPSMRASSDAHVLAHHLSGRSAAATTPSFRRAGVIIGAHSCRHPSQSHLSEPLPEEPDSSFIHVTHVAEAHLSNASPFQTPLHACMQFMHACALCH